MTLTRLDIVLQIASATGLTRKQVSDVLEKIIEHFAAALARGDKVEIRNFGAFHVAILKGRIGRNPKRPGSEVRIPDRAKVKFKPGKKLRGQVLKLTPGNLPGFDEPTGAPQ